MLLIYAPSVTPRLQYTLQLIFHELLHTAYEFTTDLSRLAAYDGPKLNYSRNKTADAVYLYSDQLLFSTGLSLQTVICADYKNLKTLFHHGQTADLPFDPLAATFYLVSRYEEYLPFQPDEHGRFPAAESLNFKEGFHQIPVVNHYALLIREILQTKYPDLIFPEKRFHFQLTYDIDMAYAFREKGLLRNTGGLLRSLKNLNLNEMALRIRVLSGLEDDPFDTFNDQQALHKKYNLHPIYFFLLGDYSSYDKNLSWTNKQFREMVKAISIVNETGIHSSYASNSFPEKVVIEKERLEQMTGKKVFRNRQHFLKMQLPVTYRQLLAAGITEDYTMGYSSQTGFRAGIASPFYFYDISAECTTDLLVYPFVAMDATLFYYLKLDADTSLLQVKKLVDEVRKVNGTFTFLAHNDLISSKGPWLGWKENFESLIAYCMLQE